MYNRFQQNPRNDNLTNILHNCVSIHFITFLMIILQLYNIFQPTRNRPQMNFNAKVCLGSKLSLWQEVIFLIFKLFLKTHFFSVFNLILTFSEVFCSVCSLEEQQYINFSSPFQSNLFYLRNLYGQKLVICFMLSFENLRSML